MIPLCNLHTHTQFCDGRADMEQFVSYMEGQLDTVEPEINREDLRRIFLDIYANPVVTKELLAKEKTTGSLLL